MPKQPPKKPDHMTTKIPIAARELAQRLQEIVAAKGWQAFGINRTDPPTLGAVIEEGLKKLDAAIQGSHAKEAEQATT